MKRTTICKTRFWHGEDQNGRGPRKKKWKGGKWNNARGEEKGKLKRCKRGLLGNHRNGPGWRSTKTPTSKKDLNPFKTPLWVEKQHSRKKKSKRRHVPEWDRKNSWKAEKIKEKAKKRP